MFTIGLGRLLRGPDATIPVQAENGPIGLHSAGGITGQVRRRSRNIVVHLGRLAPLAAVLMLWEWASQTGLVNPFLVPPPSAIAKRWVELIGPGGSNPYILISHILTSLFRLASGLIISASLGTAIGLAMGLSSLVRKSLQPIVSLLMPVPGLAWAPILLLVLGFDYYTIVAVIVLASIWAVIVQAMTGVDAVTKQQRWALSMMGGERTDMVRLVIIPGALPHILTGLRVATGYGWRALVGAEFLAATAAGVGFMIFVAREYLDTSTVYAGVATIALLGVVMERVMFAPIEARTTRRWGMIVR